MNSMFAEEDELGRARGAARALLRPAAGLLAALVVWYWSSQAVRDVLLFGCALFALVRGRRHLGVWRSAGGALFLAVVAYTLLGWAWSVDRAATGRDIIKMTGILAGCLAVPAIFPGGMQTRRAFRFSALAITLILACDLVRLTQRLGFGQLIAQARFEHPYVLNHPNVSSIMAAFAFWTLAFAVLSPDLRPRLRAGAAAAALLNLVYLVVMASRGPQLAFVAAAAALPLLMRGRTLRFALLTAVIAAIALAAMNLERISPRFLETNSMRSLSDRDIVWSRTYGYVKERPVFGHGYGKKVFEKVFYADGGPRNAIFHYPHPHQFWLKILFEGGVVGFALHLAAWGMLLWLLLGALVSERDRLRRLDRLHMFALLLTLHVYGLGDFPDGIVQDLMFLCVPATLTLIRESKPNGGRAASVTEVSCASA